jgi:hypothetical protein
VTPTVPALLRACFKIQDFMILGATFIAFVFLTIGVGAPRRSLNRCVPSRGLGIMPLPPNRMSLRRAR